LTIIITSSCSSDDDSDANDSSGSIIGKWKLTAASYGGQSENLSDCEKQQTLEFFTNGSVENYFVDNYPCDFSTINVDYSKNNNQLVFTIEGEGVNGGNYILTSNIEILNNNTLRFRYISDNEEGSFPSGEQDTETYERLD
jgi:hypothetical protein